MPAKRRRRNPEEVPKPIPGTVRLSEDEADYIVSERRMREPGGVTFRQYLKSHGLTLDRDSKTIRPTGIK
jgi:hypothetical protein